MRPEAQARSSPCAAVQLDPAQQRELRETGTVTLPSEYDPGGYKYRLSLFEDGKRHLVLRQAIGLECPVRLLHGMNDASVPWRTSLSLAERLTSRNVVVTLVKDGDHRLSREADLERCRELQTTYVDLRLGVVDASVIALVERLGEPKLATLDHRHFSAVRPARVGAGSRAPCP